MRLKKFNTFINENMAQAKSIVAKKMEAFEKLKDLLVKNVGYIGKFTEYLINDDKETLKKMNSIVTNYKDFGGDIA